MRRILLGLGSNKNYNGKSPLQILEEAQKDIDSILKNTRYSSIYKTKAMYVEDQDDFYNMAVVGYAEDEISPFILLDLVNRIEAKHGRNRKNEIRFGPRTLDIDIELYGNESVNEENLQIPHPRIEERAFVLIPAIEILTDSADELVRAHYTKCLSKLAQENKASGIEKLGGNYGRRRN